MFPPTERVGGGAGGGAWTGGGAGQGQGVGQGEGQGEGQDGVLQKKTTDSEEMKTSSWSDKVTSVSGEGNVALCRILVFLSGAFLTPSPQTSLGNMSRLVFFFRDEVVLCSERECVSI